jgi:MFS-type transporter involved in bile tolerance (Atg22 family)
MHNHEVEQLEHFTDVAKIEVDWCKSLTTFATASIGGILTLLGTTYKTALSKGWASLAVVAFLFCIASAAVLFALVIQGLDSSLNKKVLPILMERMVNVCMLACGLAFPFGVICFGVFVLKNL